jgi:restriction endonuclease S subunit
MPIYICNKCSRVFKQKSGYNDHVNKKIDCADKTVINTVIENKIAEKVKEVIRELNPLAEIILPVDKTQQEELLQKFFEGLHNLLWNRAGLNPERALEHMTFFFAYRLIEAQADALNLPQECRWSYVASLKNENDLFEAIKKGVSSFRAKPKTKPFFKPHEIQKADIVFEIVRQINRIPLKALQETDTLGNIFEYMLGRGMSTMSDEGQYFTNRAICRLAFKLAYNIKKTLRRTDGSLCTFADWFCGTGGFPAEYVRGVKNHLADVDWKKECGVVYCQDMNLSSVTTTLLNMLILTGIPFSGEKIRDSNSFSDPITTGAGAPFTGLAVDYCFMNPPYGGDKSKGKEYKFAYSKKVKAEDGTTSKKFFVNAEIQSIGIEDDDKVSAGVQLAMATLSADGGVCSIVLPQGFFFGASKKCIELRKKIAEEYKIWYIVDIASGSFINTGTKTSMMVFQRGVGPTEKVSFIGLDETVLVEANLAELRAKHYSLNYKQYLPQSAVEVEGFEMVKLEDICQLISGYAFKSDSFTSNITDLRVLKIKNIKDRKVVFDESDDRYVYTDKLEKFIVKENEFVVAMTGATTGKVGIHTSTEKVLLNQRVGKFSNFKDNIIPQYVYYYIRDNPNLFMDLAAGTARDNISPDQILSVRIPLPSLERQQQIVEAIDGWTNLAQNEEVSLKILEKQMIFQVKEMGRGQARVKLGSLIDINYGERITKKESQGDAYPVFGSGGDTFRYEKKNREGVNCKVGRFAISEHNCVQIMFMDYWCLDSALTITAKDTNVINCYLWYWLLNNKYLVYECSRGTAQQHIDMDSFRNFEIPLPPLTEQQTLQSDFDEIRHKHAKIATYKAKAQEAIQRLIPGAM